MDPVTKTKSLVWIIIFLLISNLAMLVFFVVLGNGTKRDHSRKDMIGNFLKKDVGFDKQQMEQYENLHKEHFTQMLPYFDSIHNSKDSFYDLLKTGLPDSALEKKASRIGERQVLLDMEMFRHFRHVRSLCTPEQLPKFDSSFHSVISRMTQHNRRTPNPSK